MLVLRVGTGVHVECSVLVSGVGVLALVLVSVGVGIGVGVGFDCGRCVRGDEGVRVDGGGGAVRMHLRCCSCMYL